MGTSGELTSTITPAPRGAARGRWALAHSVGIILLFLWALYFVSSLWAAPVSASGNSLRSATEHGQVTDIDRVAARPSQLSATPMLLFRQDTSTDSSGEYLVWTARSGHRYYTDAATFPGPLPNAAARSGTSYVNASSDPSYVDRVTDYVVNRTSFHGGVVWTGTAQLLLMLVVFGSLLGRNPHNGTRWFWFWVLNLPLGIGIVWYTVSEQLHDSTPFAIPRRGGQGFLLGLAGIAFIPLAVLALQQLFNRI